MQTGVIRRVSVLSVMMLVAALATYTYGAPATSRSTLAQYGLQYEAARVAAAAGDMAALDILAKALAGEDQDDLAGDRRDVLAMLRGSIHFSAGRYAEAVDALATAAANTDDPNLQAAAAFRRIEAAHQTQETAGQWRQWLARYPQSPLVTEAALRLVWIHLHTGETRLATETLDHLVRQHEWLADTQHYHLVRAAMAFMADDNAACLALLDSSSDGPAPRYLAALCHQRLGQHLKAAAGFQQVTDRYPGSPLHDHALFAKANTFLVAHAYRSAAEDFARVVDEAGDPQVRAEAALRHASAVHLDGDHDEAAQLMRDVVFTYRDTDVAARAQFLLGEVMVAAGDYPAAIVEYTRVLSKYFDSAIAASAQYRLAGCYKAINRPADATASYMAVVSGYPAEPEAPAAAYLAGTALLEAGKPAAAVPYFQIVLDRYAKHADGEGALVFPSPEHQEQVEAALCMLEVAWYQVGDLGQLTGTPHMLLHALLEHSPASNSFWRAWTVLIDADAMASQGNYDGARRSLETLRDEFPQHPAVLPASQLLAWTYAQQGEVDLAIATNKNLLNRFTGQRDLRPFSEALLNTAHVHFNQKNFQEAAHVYEEFLIRYPDHEQRLLALYQAGLCYLRLARGGNAVDCWETIVRTDPGAAIAEKAWARAGDLYFQAEHYTDAKRCYQGLLDSFGDTQAAGLGMLRIAQCDYNAGRDAEAVAGFEALSSRYPGSRLQDEADKGIELALYRMGQHEGGVAELSLLLKKYPDSTFAPDAQFQIATRLYDTQQYVAAADEYRRVVSRFPGSSTADRAQLLMAESYEKAGDLVRARQAYEQFFNFFADSELVVSARFRLGMNYFEAGEYDQAYEHFAVVVHEDAFGPANSPGSAQPADEMADDIAKVFLFNLGLCCRLQGKLDEAVEHFTSYQSRFPDDERAADVAFQLGDIHEQQGRIGAAITRFRDAARARPDPDLRAEIYYRMGGCFEKQDNTQKAIEAYTLASRGGDATNTFRLSSVARCAVLCEDTEQYEKALALYRDLMSNAGDPDLVAAASGRAMEIASALQ